MAEALRNALDEAEVQAQKRLVVAVQRAVDDANARSEEVCAASQQTHVRRRDDDACCEVRLEAVESVAKAVGDHWSKALDEAVAKVREEKVAEKEVAVRAARDEAKGALQELQLQLETSGEQAKASQAALELLKDAHGDG
eukprot:3547865-Prymnesium_polylepis.2